ncbi:hypothetical protein HPHPP41_1711 [Helicobacter pylori Hp P-41]|nr:hypothetical protein HPHPP41_1711 [Helicobacter pylori Hp P-41]EMG99820.1 hypothetical protein HMPREF1402_00456 [Helicobacter pylori GAM121Aii]
MLFIPQTHLKLNPPKTKIFFKSLRKRAYLKKPNDFGRSKSSNPLAHLFVPNLTNIFKS